MHRGGDYADRRVMRMHEVPGAIRACLVDRDLPPSGIGEPPTPVIAPALASALHAASGRRYRRLPLLADRDNRA